MMHESSLAKMLWFFKKYAKKHDKILDVGSCSIQGDVVIGRTYRSLLIEGKVEYIGLDIKPGTNVDLVVKDPYKWAEIKDNTYDLIISGQSFEHMEFFWLVFVEMTRVLKPNGYMCIIVPKYHMQHRFPVDCWRFLPDGMRALAKYAGIKCIKATADHIEHFFRPGSHNKDCMGVFQK